MENWAFDEAGKKEGISIAIDPNLITAIFGLVGAVIGGSMAFYAQRWYFGQMLKKQIIEEVYRPLIYDLENDISYRVNNLENVISTKWEALRRSYKDMWIPISLREKLAQFFESDLQSYNVDLTTSTNTIQQIIQKDFVEKYREKDIVIGGILDKEFINAIIKLDLKDGGYLGGMPRLRPIQLTGHHRMDLETPSHIDIIRNVAEKVKNSSSVINAKKQRLMLIQTIYELTEKLKKHDKL